ncbi:MAG: hypothetical protein HQK72_11745 [Desulfamplus sp.]|nr:hypothetical protein [Desulfamplus sp.]
MERKASIGAGAEEPHSYVAGHTVFGEPRPAETVVYGVIEQLSHAQPGDIQLIAASQIKLLDSYYKTVLAQAAMSFKWALV